MTPPYRICLKPGCCGMVKKDDRQQIALTCNRSICKKYMNYLADVVENDDGAPFDLKAIGMQYYKMIKIFDVTLDKDSMKKYTDALRNTIAQIKIDIAGDTENPQKRSRTEFECEAEIDDDPMTLPSKIETLLKNKIVHTMRDMTDDTFNTITDQESLARFCYETVLAPYGASDDFDLQWMTREDYGRSL
jgi:hypothetical protein